MARPARYNAEYFSHDADFRNDRRIKAIRAKFGLTGYALCVMLMEVLTDADYTQLDTSEMELELLSGDLGVSVTEIHSLIQFATKIGFFTQNDTGILKCPDLDRALEPVFDKRNRAKIAANKGNNIVSVTETPVTVTETPQSKVKESKVEESKVNISTNNGSVDPTTPKPKSFEDRYKAFIELFNKITNRTGNRVFKGDNSSRNNFKARLNEGKQYKDFVLAITNGFADSHNWPSPDHFTPELLTRPAKFEKYLAMNEEAPKEPVSKTKLTHAQAYGYE